MRRTLLPGQTPDDDLLALDQTLTQLERDDPVCASLGNGAPENLDSRIRVTRLPDRARSEHGPPARPVVSTTTAAVDFRAAYEVIE